MKRNQFIHALLSMAVIGALVGSGTVVGGNASFVASARSTPAGTATAAMRVVELPGVPGYPEIRPTSLNNHGTTVGYAMDYPRTRALTWNRAGKLTELPAIGGSSSAVQVNNRGTAVGYVSTPSDRQFPALWDAAGRLTVLPSLGDRRTTEVRAINDNGIAVGVAYNEQYDWRSYLPVRWDRKHRIAELPLPPGYRYGAATLINKPGMVAGFAAKDDESWRAVRWGSKGNVRVLETLGGPTSWVSAINNHGVMVGRADWAPYRPSPVRWDRDGRITELPSLSPGRHYGYVAEINERGIAVGVSDVDPPLSEAVRWDRDGRLSQLPSLNGSIGDWASAINERGVIVGSALMGDYSSRPVMWDRDGGLRALPSPDGYESASAEFINEHGIIVGSGTGPDGRGKALLWRVA